MPQDGSIAQPAGHLRLHFDEDRHAKGPRNLSAVEQIGSTLWLGSDEGSYLDRLSTADHANYDDHMAYALSDFFDLPGGSDGEVDLEGLGVDRTGKRLWFTGSHSLRREVPKIGDDGRETAHALRNINRQPNRFLLGSVGFNIDANGIVDLVPGSGQALPFDAGGSRLGEMLANDVLIGPFLAIPAKENGLDIEGLAVDADMVFLGLRGPVLRGWAVILQLSLEQTQKGLLEPQPLTQKGRRYLRHLINLDGLGMRDLCVLNDDLLVLAGPTMDLDGPIRLFRWRNALKMTSDQRVDGNTLEVLFDIPWGFRTDHAEGIALFRAPDRAEPRLLVVYDSPAKSRLHQGHYFEADLFSLR
ncbi:DUF3616 domain-containing protein [Bradyrhizobium sp. Arg314]